MVNRTQSLIAQVHPDAENYKGAIRGSYQLEDQFQGFFKNKMNDTLKIVCVTFIEICSHTGLAGSV